MTRATELPAGTVTFLFTDIEHSTQSAEALGDERWADVLQTHRDLLRPVFDKQGGVEVGTEGDAFFVAFTRAADAVAAAADGQRALADGSELRVRMGLHTGEALVRGSDYVGHEVHRAKRISDAGHGRQILLSQTTADLVGSYATVMDLGPHRLKDLGEPQRIYQLVAEDLPNKFPPLRSLESFTHSLPLQRSSFVGRANEIAEVRELLATNRIVTLTGIGGCGKTRLALQVGAEELDNFANGVFFVNLAPISEVAAVAREIASSLGVPAGSTLGSMGGASEAPMDEAVLGHLASRCSLIVLDNCEHLLDACADLADRILARCPKVKVLATSREGLRVEGEQTWVIPSLSVPTEDIDAHASESVSLFKERARSVRPDFELTPDNIGAVVEICRRLDGIPLAIEFAATRVGHLSPRQIADRLDDRFRLLTGGQRRVQRQQTLQAALDWSYELLDEAERVLLRRVAVFQGDFSLEEAEGVCSDDLVERTKITDVLGSLIAKSLVLAELSAAEVRYRLLETVRAYAAERLAHAEEAHRFRQRHRDFFVERVGSVPWDLVLTGIDHWRRLVRDRPNLRSAVEWSISEGRHDLVGRVAAHMFSFYGGSAELIETQRWFEFAIEGEDQLDPDDRVVCLTALGARPQGALTGERFDLLERAVRHADEASPIAAAFALMNRGWMGSIIAASTKNDELAARCYHDVDEAVRLTAASDRAMRAFALSYRGQTDMNFARVKEARAPFAEARQLLSAGEDVAMGWVTFFLATIAHIDGDNATAADALHSWRRMMKQWQPGDDPGWWPSGTESITAGVIAQLEGVERARGFLRERRPAVRRSAIGLDLTSFVLGCAIVCTIEGDHRRAASLLSWFSANTFGSGLPPRSSFDYVLYLHYRDTVRSALDPAAIAQARDEGRRMSFDETVELFFEETTAP